MTSSYRYHINEAHGYEAFARKMDEQARIFDSLHKQSTATATKTTGGPILQKKNHSENHNENTNIDDGNNSSSGQHTTPPATSDGEPSESTENTKAPPPVPSYFLSNWDSFADSVEWSSPRGKVCLLSHHSLLYPLFFD